MEIIKDDMEKVLMETNFVYREKFPDAQLNLFYNYWYFLNEHEEELQIRKNLSLKTILYSKYYWNSRLTDRFHEIYGSDAGIDQQQFMHLEEMDQRLENIDWNFVEMLELGKI